MFAYTKRIAETYFHKNILEDGTDKSALSNYIKQVHLPQEVMHILAHTI